jgi:LAGLIDADG endonuclease
LISWALRTAGDGCYLVNILKTNSTKSGEAVQLVFSISQHLRDSQLLQSFIDYLKCGRVKQRKGKESVEYLVTRLSDINEKIIPCSPPSFFFINKKKKRGF